MNGYSKADVHIHTNYSDGLNDPESVINYVITQTDLSVIAITDHNTIDGAHVAYNYWHKHRNAFRELEIIKGIEISSEIGHIIGLFLEEDIPAHMSAEDTIQAIHDQGGIAIAAHPFTHLLPFTDFVGVGKRISDLPLDAVEERSSVPTELYANWMTAYYNQKHQKLARMGSSDAHYLTMIGKTFTWFPGKTAMDLRQAIEHRMVRAGGQVNGPAIIFQVMGHLIKRRKLPVFLPTDRDYKHHSSGLTIRTIELRQSPTVILQCAGELVRHNADHFKTRAMNSLHGGYPQQIVDMHQISFIDSAGIGAILAIFKHAQKYEGKIALCGLSDDLRRSLQLLRLDKVLPIFSSVEEATQWMTGAVLANHAQPMQISGG